MKEYTVLTINPGSSGTKMGVVRGGKVILDVNVDSLPGEFDGCATFADQAPLREAKIFKALEDAGIALSEIDAISGRGVGVRSCVGGTYEINELAYPRMPVCEKEFLPLLCGRNSQAVKEPHQSTRYGEVLLV